MTPVSAPTTDPLAGRAALSVADAALALSISPRTVRRMIDDGRLPSVRLNRCVRIPAAALRAALAPPPRRRRGG